MYYKAEPYAGPVITRCSDCGLKSYETSGSSYIQTVGRIAEQWTDDYPDRMTAAEEIASDLEDLKDELECNLDNIPEQLQDGAAGSLLQERIEELESAIDELQSIDYEEFEQNAREEAEFSVGDYDPEDEDCEFESQEEWEEAVQDAMEDVDNLVSEAIWEALSSLTY